MSDYQIEIDLINIQVYFPAKVSQGIHPKTRPLANSKTKNNHIIVRWRSSLKDLIRS